MDKVDKKFFKKLHLRLKHVNLWVLLVVALVSGVVFAISMRNNNITALRLRDKVNQVDKDNGDVEAALRELRVYMYSHMNTNLASGPNAIKPPIQLKYRYERLVKAEQDRLSKENADVYTAAQAECEKKFPKGLSGSGRIPCITEYVSARGVQQKPIPDSFYKFDFVSPIWSPDLAGWSLIVAAISAALFVIRLGLDRWAKAELRDL
jgi:hypothetical protein